MKNEEVVKTLEHTNYAYRMKRHLVPFGWLIWWETEYTPNGGDPQHSATGTLAFVFDPFHKWDPNT